MTALDPAAVAAALQAACLAELTAIKPGNVHIYADGHGMAVGDFRQSAACILDPLTAPGLPLGRRVFEAVARTRAAVGCNTNLGIVLLCAPLTAAALEGRGGPLRRRLRRVLAGLTAEDSRDVFAAIRLAEPGGLGAAERHDVRGPAPARLLDAMAAAADRDRIARQYVTAFADVFGIGRRRLRRAMTRWGDRDWATTSAYLGFLSHFADSHVSRKQGPAVATKVQEMARRLDLMLSRSRTPDRLKPALLAADRAFKEAKINPGSSADLTVASLLVVALETLLAPVL